jgi:Rrf2 family protein
MARPTNTQFSIGVHMLTLLSATPDQVQSSEVLASSAGANPVHVRRVLGRLRAAGLVSSRPGVGGGWQPLADPEKTTLADVWRAVQGDDPVLGLHEASPNCEVGQAIQGELAGIDREVATALERELERTTVADLTRATRPVAVA